MRIGIDARWIFPEITGIGSYTQELIRQLAQIDQQNEYVIFFRHASVRERTSTYAELTAAENFASCMVSCGPFSALSQWVMPRLIRKHELDVFHSTNFMIPFPCFPRKHKGATACVVTIHDLIPLLFPEHTPRALKSRFHPVFRAVLRAVGDRADTIITVSESSRRDIIRHMTIPSEREDRVIAIYEGVAERYVPAPRVPSELMTILYVGRMDPYKNVPGLVRAFKQVLATGAINARLRIIGPRDPRYPEVEQLIDHEQLSGHIDWPGYVDGDALLRAYQEADLFVLPSLYEGFGLPVLEAMACGVPVVCSDRASLPEVAGDAALLVDPVDVDGLASAIRSVLTDTAKAEFLRIRGLARAAQFSWRRTAEETLKAYVQLHEDGLL